MMRKEELPEQCPKCGGSRLARILWGYFMFTGEEVEAVGAGRTLFGLGLRYFKALRPGDPAPTLLLEETRLPRWACLDCNPRWLDLHELTLQQHEAEAAKFAAVDAGDFERAAGCLRRQREIERGQGGELLVLLRELVGGAVTALPGAFVPQTPPPVE